LPRGLPPCRFTLDCTEGLATLPHFVPRVLLTAAIRPARVPRGNCRVSCSGQSRRGQFQIGKSSQHSRRVGGRVLALPPLATNHSLLTTSSSNRHIPELEFGLTPSIVSNLKFSNRHTFAVYQPLRPQRLKPRVPRPFTARLKACPDANPKSRVAGRRRYQHRISNRNIPKLEFSLAPSNINHLNFSNRNTLAIMRSVGASRPSAYHFLPAPAPCPKIKWNPLRAVLSPSLEEPRP